MARSAAASFLGSHTNRIDAKGRVAAPADFRKALDLTAFNGFFCVPSLDGGAIDCGGPDFIEGLKAMISALDPFDDGRILLEEELLGRARPISFDADGRFILPKELREHAGIDGEAFFIGLGEKFQIRKPAEGQAPSEERKARAKAALARLRNPGATPANAGPATSTSGEGS